jgi:hypothetical protein
MKTFAFVAILLLCPLTYVQLDRVLKQAEDTVDQRDTSGLSDSKITSGLREALQVSTGNAVAQTGKPDGFLKNEAIKILLPSRFESVAKGARMFGLGKPFDDLEVGMNRAAEASTPLAKQIFLSALRKMTFTDVRHILAGNDTAATDYFKRQSSADLTTAFTPVVHTSMEDVGLVAQYDRLLKDVPEASAISQEFDLDKYVVGKTLDGLFYMLGEEEKKIRHHPIAQTTALLKEVFGRK